MCVFRPKQLIGWREVPRPNSRSEIVQAMRRIRVSFGKQSSPFFSTILEQPFNFYIPQPVRVQSAEQ